MAEITSGSKLVFISSDVPTRELRGARSNGLQEVHTIEDVKETVNVYDNSSSGLSATNMQDAIDEVVASIPATPTTCIITIPSASDGAITYSDGRPNAVGGILGMGTTSIELLPAPGVGMYYEIDKIILEYTHVTTNYTLGTISYLTGLVGGEYIYEISSGILANGANKYGKMLELGSPDSVESLNYNNFLSLNSNLELTTYDNTNPTLGDGTLRVIVTYTLRTFGA